MKPHQYRANTMILAFTISPLLTMGKTYAAPHVKHAAKAGHALPAAQGTRLVATGSVDPNTSSVKAISADNRFTWVQVQPTTLVVQAGKRITVAGISEGDKLLCQGVWVDDAWGPMFRAKRVEIIGHISDAGLQDKVAVACQSVSRSGSDNVGSTSFGQAASDPVKHYGRDQQNYPAALQDRLDDLDQAKQALWDQVEQSNGCQRAEARRDRSATGDDRDLAKDFEQARQNFDTAVDRLANISPSNYNVNQSCASFRKFSDHIHDGYPQITGGLDDGLLRYWLVDYNEGLRLSRKAVAEIKAHH